MTTVFSVFFLIFCVVQRIGMAGMVVCLPVAGAR